MNPPRVFLIRVNLHFMTRIIVMMKTGKSLVGRSERGRLLAVCYTLRDDAIRIISARKATNQEAEDYARRIRS